MSQATGSVHGVDTSNLFPTMEGSDVIDLKQWATYALTTSQQSLLDKLPATLRRRVEQRLAESLGIAARQQLSYCICAGISTQILQHIVATEHDQLAVKEEQDALLRRLLLAGASLAMLQTLLGISKQTFTRLRKELGILEYRQRTLDEQAEHDLYRLWERLGKNPSIDGLLQLHDASGHPLRLIWELVQDWQRVTIRQQTQPQSATHARRW